MAREKITSNRLSRARHSREAVSMSLHRWNRLFSAAAASESPVLLGITHTYTQQAPTKSPLIHQAELGAVL